MIKTYHFYKSINILRLPKSSHPTLTNNYLASGLKKNLKNTIFGIFVEVASRKISAVTQ